ncbi:hypothetical protein DUI87_28959 [Hirundo rustica rustica]|uniref:Uncharacterized protein n=1 Tax=Hirundo rustica rustica TaxID=333673 RepID=A0A3M0IZG8_HIRRU|nr:hypothetical protein DUI87_28959 [Hirundo rustica rustica]
MRPELLAEPLREVRSERLYLRPNAPRSGSGMLWRGAGHRRCPRQPSPRTPGRAQSSLPAPRPLPRHEASRSAPPVSVLPKSASQPQDVARARWLTCTLGRHLQEEEE